ncbi:MAG TPA: toll/interleukin-1 receptor domain-containing protein [Longimicrobium sp.]|nr:toll/interleukin-1 receptor domain-containing protein [Longimicrobium sp.]
MKVFLSWSGERSRVIAEALRKWLPDVIQNIEPWMSAADIDAGARWNRHIEDELKTTQVGILCLTRDNQKAPWILFEAGALAKTVSDTLVCPYLIGFSSADLISGPLTRFQAKEANAGGTWDLVLTLNRALKDHALPEERLKRIFDRFWPDLENVLAELPLPADDQARRPVEDMVEEILALVRGLATRSSTTDPTEAWVIDLLGTTTQGSDDSTKSRLMRSYFEYLLWKKSSSVMSKLTLGQALKNLAQEQVFLDDFSGKPDSNSGEVEDTETRAGSDPSA